MRTPFPGLVLAGDGIRIDLPVALMERAASTGWHAANCLLARWGLAGHELYTVPTRGRLAGLRWLAAHAPGPRRRPSASHPTNPASPHNLSITDHSRSPRANPIRGDAR